MGSNGDEQRHFSRIPFDCDVVVIDRNVHWPTHLLDISLNGALVSRPAEWQPNDGDLCELQIKLNDNTIVIDMEEATIAHISDDRVGFKCRIIDIDSITHLKRLVELNLGDPELIHRELAALGEQQSG